MHYMEIENHDDFCRFDDEGCAYVCDHVGVSIMYDTALDDLEELERKLLVVGSYYMRMAALKGRYIHTYICVEHHPLHPVYNNPLSILPTPVYNNPLSILPTPVYNNPFSILPTPLSRPPLISLHSTPLYISM